MNEKLIPALRQFRHNDGEGFVNGYDMAIVDREFARLEATESRLRYALTQVESVYRLNVVKDGEPSGTLENMQRVLAEVDSQRVPPKGSVTIEVTQELINSGFNAEASRMGGITSKESAETAAPGASIGDKQ